MIHTSHRFLARLAPPRAVYIEVETWEARPDPQMVGGVAEGPSSHVEIRLDPTCYGEAMRRIRNLHRKKLPDKREEIDPDLHSFAIWIPEDLAFEFVMRWRKEKARS